MPSRVTVFDQFGYPLAELKTATVRSWVLDDVGRCQFPLASFTDPNVRRDILQYGNLLLVEHIPTMDYAGNFHGTLPPWVGIILPPQAWDFGHITVTAFSAEVLMALRPMPYIKDRGTAGSIFSDMIGFANALNGLQLEVGNIFSGSTSLSMPLSLSMLDEAKHLSKSLQQDFSVDYYRSTGNSIVLRANWYDQIGVTVGAVFTEGTGGNMKLPKLTEQGTIVNDVLGYSSASTSGTRFASEAFNEFSAGDYGIFGMNQNFPVKDQAGVDAATLNYLQKNNRPIITLDLTALDVGLTFSGLAVGNVWDVVLKSVGFYAGAIGFQGAVRLTGIEYDDWTNEARLTTQVLRADLTEANYA